MKYAFLIVALLPLPSFADGEIFLSCKVIQIAATEGEAKVDKRLKKIGQFVAKNDSFKKYGRLRYVATKNLSATKARKGRVKLKNKSEFALKPVSVYRAQRKNTITVEAGVDGSAGRKQFVDREYLLMDAGKYDKKSDLLLAITCPVFP
jgi:hypothetical protein